MNIQLKPPSWLELESIIPLELPKAERDAKRITGLSEDTIKRNFPEYVKKLSARRLGMKLRDALTIATGK